MRISLFAKRPSGKEIDPVCRMDVSKDHPSGGTWEYNNLTYYFCGPGCNRAFQKEPEPYLSGEKRVEM